MSTKLAVVVSSDITIKAFLHGHLAAWSKRYALTVFANTDDSDLLMRLGVTGKVEKVGIERTVQPFADLCALLTMMRKFRNKSFDAIFSVTPKAGLLAMLSAFIACVPVRIHVFTGQVWATRRGLSRLILKSADRLTAALATHVLVDSASQRDFLIAEGVIQSDRSAVLAEGSISGVDPLRFKPDAKERAAIRRRFGIPDSAPLLLFVGRLNPDKGVQDIAAAFMQIASSWNVHLMIVGPDESDMHDAICNVVRAHAERVHFVEYTSTPEHFMAAADIFCLPSYREGFGSVVIEAAAVGVPAIASRIYGLTDAVEDGVTGLLHSPGDVAEISACLMKLLSDEALRREMSEAARLRAIRSFSSERVTQAFVDYIQQRLGDPVAN
ncbi:MAG TPA: glycosyltransferase family 4 protein [Rhodocyclaceae bacterium]|nr:glycosyltransferase family 4 protein [Rhodocyclaceae bacterium]